VEQEQLDQQQLELEDQVVVELEVIQELLQELQEQPTQVVEVEVEV
jgi:hypothetical protein